MDEMLLEVIKSYNEYLKKVPAGCLVIADLIRKNEIPVALQSILDFSEGAGWLISAAELLGKNNIEVKFEAEKVNEFLNEVNNGLSIQDYVIVADMFEYEIAPFFESTPFITEIVQ